MAYDVFIRMASYSNDAKITTFINKSPKLRLAIQRAEVEAGSAQTEEGNLSKSIENPENAQHEPVSAQGSSSAEASIVASILESAKPLSEEEITDMVKEAQKKMVGYGKFAFKTREKALELGKEFLDLNKYQPAKSKIFDSIAKLGKEAALKQWKQKQKKASKMKAKSIELVAYASSSYTSHSMPAINREPYSLRSANDKENNQRISLSESFVPIDILSTTESLARNDEQTIEAESSSMTRKRSLSPPTTTTSTKKNVRQSHSIHTDDVLDLSLDDEEKEEENVEQNVYDLIETPTNDISNDFDLMEWGYVLRSSMYFDKSWVCKNKSNHIAKLRDTLDNIGGKQCAACFNKETNECDQVTRYSVRCFHPLCHAKKLYFCKTHYLHRFDNHHVTFSTDKEYKNP
jgi:hypothetical protein